MPDTNPPRGPRIPTLLLLGALAASPVIRAQVDWFPMPDLPARSGVSTSEDPSGSGLIRFGGTSVVGRHADTVRWDGSTWRTIETAGAPSPRSDAAMARDPVTGRVVLFGGLGYAPNGLLLYLDDTWEFDGATWTRLQPATTPPPRSGARIAWHAPTQRLVMVGGTFLNSYRADTWEWDGVNWTERTVATSLPAMQTFRMVEDPLRGRLVLHGGDTRPSTRDFGTFEWDGTDWTRMQPANPLMTVGLGMAFDAHRQRVIAHGPSWPAPASQTYEWDGVDWTRSAIVPPPSGGTTELFADSATGGLLMLDASSSPEPVIETWLLDALGWHLGSFVGRPPASSTLGLVYNTPLERAFLYLGSDVGVLGTSTWTLSRAGWKRILATVQPPRRTSFGMVQDTHRSRAVLFGGADGITAVFDETWSFNGQQWTLETPASRPPASFTHAMAFDSDRDRVVLFGGQSFVTLGAAFTQTWEYDGSNWTQHQPATLPPGRFAASMAFDPLRHETVLFGGSLAAGGVAGDTWVWDGIDWSPRSVSIAPPPRFLAAMAFDEARGVLVLCGGRSGPLSALFEDVWEWDGATWTERTPSSRIVARSGAGLCFVPWLEGCLVYGGQELTGHPEDTGFVYRPVDPARASPYGASCAGTLGPLRVGAMAGTWPFLGRSLTLEIAPLRSGQLALLNFGLSDRLAGNLTLPFDLSPIGMVGCHLLASLEASAIVQASGPVTRFTLTIPMQPSLVGADLFHQVLAVDPGANAAGLVTSRGLHLRIGRW